MSDHMASGSEDSQKKLLPFPPFSIPFHLSMKTLLTSIPRCKVLVHSPKIPLASWESELREMLMKFSGMQLNVRKHELHCLM
jgi:hypothetical protein